MRRQGLSVNALKLKFRQDGTFTIGDTATSISVGLVSLSAAQRAQLQTFTKVKLYGVKLKMTPLHGIPTVGFSGSTPTLHIFKRTLLINERNVDKVYVNSDQMAQHPRCKYFRYGQSVNNWIRVKGCVNNNYTNLSDSTALVSTQLNSSPWLNGEDLVGSNINFGNIWFATESNSLGASGLVPSDYMFTATYYFKCIGFRSAV